MSIETLDITKTIANKYKKDGLIKLILGVLKYVIVEAESLFYGINMEDKKYLHKCRIGLVGKNEKNSSEQEDLKEGGRWKKTSECSDHSRRIYKVKKVFIFGDAGFTISENNKIIPYITKKHRIFCVRKRYKYGNKKIFKRLLVGKRNKLEILDKAFLLTGLWTNNYYHWVVEYLPKIRALKKYEKMYESKPKVLIAKNPPGWMKETLDAFNIDEERRIEKRNREVKIKNAIITDHRMGTGGKHNTFDLSEKDIQYVKEKAKGRAKKVNSISPKKIYVSRQNSRGRKVENFEELKEMLVGKGFKILLMEEMSFLDQVNIFDNIEKVVAPHGAGLTNVIFAREGTSIIEVLPKSPYNAHYHRLADTLDHNYKHYFCKTLSNGNIIVNINGLEKKISRL